MLACMPSDIQGVLTDRDFVTRGFAARGFSLDCKSLFLAAKSCSSRFFLLTKLDFVINFLSASGKVDAPRPNVGGGGINYFEFQ